MQFGLSIKDAISLDHGAFKEYVSGGKGGQLGLAIRRSEASPRTYSIACLAIERGGAGGTETEGHGGNNDEFVSVG
jgi:hypothetical protein